MKPCLQIVNLASVITTDVKKALAGFHPKPSAIQIGDEILNILIKDKETQLSEGDTHYCGLPILKTKGEQVHFLFDVVVG